MPGKHRKQSPIRTEVAKRGGTGLAAAALSVTGLSTAVVTGTTAAVAPNVQLTALVSAANSTSQFFAGSSYYGTDWTRLVYGDAAGRAVLPGAAGHRGCHHRRNDDASQTGVTASGWGAGQTGTALGISAEQARRSRQHRPRHPRQQHQPCRRRILDDLLPVRAAAVHLCGRLADQSSGVTVLDVAYEYNINSDAPVDPLNPFALGNSLAAYAFGYGARIHGR